MHPRKFVVGVALIVASATVASAPDHTLVVLSHSNHTVYELDPATGRIVHEFVTPDQPHEAAISADGATIFASVPAASFVSIWRADRSVWRSRRTGTCGSTKMGTGR